MRRIGPSSRFSHAVVGVIALYALLLQAFVASATPPASASQVGLCSPLHDADPERPSTPAPHDHQCCTAAHLGALAVPPAGSFVTVRPYASSRVLHHRPEAAIPKTGPPVHAQGPRGPPLA